MEKTIKAGDKKIKVSNTFVTNVPKNVSVTNADRQTGKKQNATDYIKNFKATK